MSTWPVIFQDMTMFYRKKCVTYIHMIDMTKTLYLMMWEIRMMMDYGTNKTKPMFVLDVYIHFITKVHNY